MSSNGHCSERHAYGMQLTDIHVAVAHSLLFAHYIALHVSVFYPGACHRMYALAGLLWALQLGFTQA